jgi:hypothetical protein
MEIKKKKAIMKDNKNGGFFYELNKTSIKKSEFKNDH